MRTFLLPVETLAREFEYRIALALHLVRPGRRFLIVHSALSHEIALKLENAVYVGKHAFFSHPSKHGNNFYHALKARGFGVIHHSEEGAVFTGQEESWRRLLDYQLDPSVLQPDDYLCTWGTFQRDHYIGRGAPSEPHTVVTGHPRFDLCRPQWSALHKTGADEHRKAYGQYVLINTNFAAAIHPQGPGHLFKAVHGYKPDDPASRDWYVGLWSRVMESVAHYVRFVHRASLQHPNVSFIVRPHPSDDILFLQDVFRGVRNIHVVREGSVLPWIQGADALIHDGCTTGIEAWLMNKSVITYTPSPSAHEPFLSTEVGFRTRDESDSLQALSLCLAGREIEQTTPTERGHNLFENFRSENCFMKLMQVIEDVDASLPNMSRQSDLAEMESVVRTSWIERAKRVVRPMMRKNFAANREVRARFPGFQRETTIALIEKVAAVLGKPVPQVRQIGSRYIEIRG